MDHTPNPGVHRFNIRNRLFIRVNGGTSMFVASKLGAKKVESENATHRLAQPPGPVGSFKHPPLNRYSTYVRSREGTLDGVSREY